MRNLRSIALVLTVLLAGCATAGPSREELAVHQALDDALARETDPDMIPYLQGLRATYLQALAETSNANEHHKLAINFLDSISAKVREARNIVSERRRCAQLHARLRADKTAISETVRTLATAGCDQYLQERLRKYRKTFVQLNAAPPVQSA